MKNGLSIQPFLAQTGGDYCFRVWLKSEIRIKIRV